MSKDTSRSTFASALIVRTMSVMSCKVGLLMLLLCSVLYCAEGGGVKRRLGGALQGEATEDAPSACNFFSVDAPLRGRLRRRVLDQAPANAPIASPVDSPSRGCVSAAAWKNMHTAPRRGPLHL